MMASLFNTFYKKTKKNLTNVWFCERKIIFKPNLGKIYFAHIITIIIETEQYFPLNYVKTARFFTLKLKKKKKGQIGTFYYIFKAKTRKRLKYFYDFVITIKVK